MTTTTLTSPVWLLKGITQSVPGTLEVHQDRLRFITADGVDFDVPCSEIGGLTFPWYYFGGGMKFRAAGRDVRISFVKPNGAEYALGRGAASVGNPLALLMAAVTLSHIRSGRELGRRWRQALSTATVSGR